MTDLAWKLFGNTPQGWGRVKAICDYVHERIVFNYQNADATRSAFGGHGDQTGVCRDFAHLAVTFCRCMNIPARYCTGYLGDIGVPVDPNPMDFSAWFEAYLDGRWYTFDARHNKPRIGRILMGRGRDATDVAISTTLGPALSSRFEVITRKSARLKSSQRLAATTIGTELNLSGQMQPNSSNPASRSPSGLRERLQCGRERPRPQAKSGTADARRECYPRFYRAGQQIGRPEEICPSLSIRHSRQTA
jgi:hypothetical protein